MTSAELLGLVLACAPQVAPGTILSIIDVESAGNPIAVGVNRGARLARKPTSLPAAITTVRDLKARGVNFDAGLMQINSANWTRLGLSAETVFEPCTNIRAGAQILTENYARASRELGQGRGALLAALSAYNTGNMRSGFTNGYVGKVDNAAARRAGRPLPAPIYPARSTASLQLPRASGVAPASEWARAQAWGEESLAYATSSDTSQDAY